MLIERFFTATELRTTIEADRAPVITGHAAVFNQPSQEIFGIPGWREIIRPGAFAKAIQRDDVRALINHKDDLLIGRVSNGSLTLEEDEIGLRVRIMPPDVSYANDLLRLIRGRYLTQMSFGFVVTNGEKIDRTAKLREIVEVDRLFDVSPVTEPAYRQTDVHVRSHLEQRIQEISAELPPPEAQEQSEFLAHMKEFIDRRTPPPDPNSLAEILKSARIKQ